jgi:polyhydroxyalkanoate synthesis regulator phasin
VIVSAEDLERSNAMKKKSLALGVAGALAVAGGGAAIGATQGDSPKEESEAVVNDAAKQLGVEPSALSNALKTALKNRVDAAVAAGRLTKEQGDELKARIDAGEVPLFGGLHHGGLGHFEQLDAAADYLGITEAQLQADLAAGKTLAQVAEDRGKSVDGLIQAMTDAAKERLDAAVTAGRITQAQADAVLTDVKQRITDRVNGKAPSLHGFRHSGDSDAFRGPSF